MERDGARRALLGVGGEFVLQVAAKGRNEAAGRGHRPAVVEPAQPRRHRPAAGVAGDADVLRIDLRPAEQVVERPDAVPRPPRAAEFADEELLIPREEMLADADARPLLTGEMA